MKSLSSFFSVIVKSNQAILEELLTPYLAKCNKLGIFYKCKPRSRWLPKVYKGFYILHPRSRFTLETIPQGFLISPMIHKGFYIPPPPRSRAPNR